MYFNSESYRIQIFRPSIPDWKLDEIFYRPPFTKRASLCWALAPPFCHKKIWKNFQLLLKTYNKSLEMNFVLDLLCA